MLQRALSSAVPTQMLVCNRNIFLKACFYFCILCIQISISFLNYVSLLVLGMGASGYDCLEIPGAQSGTMCAQWTSAPIKNANRFCGNSGGLAKKKDAAAAADTATVCSK